MTPRGFFDCLEVAEAERPQAQAVEFEPVGDHSTDADPRAEVAAFVHRPVPVIEARPLAVGQIKQSAAAGHITPLAEAAGFYSEIR